MVELGASDFSGCFGGHHILFCLLLGYESKTLQVESSDKTEHASLEYILAFMPFVLFGFYSLLFFRSGVLSSSRQAVYSAGRSVGTAIGYEDAGYLFVYADCVPAVASGPNATDHWILPLCHICCFDDSHWLGKIWKSFNCYRSIDRK